MSDLVSIVIPAFNQLSYCEQCVSSIQQGTDWPYRLILVDNGSTDGVGKYFDQVPGASVIHSATNVGFAAGTNLGLAHAEGHVLLLNSDTVVPNGWLSRLMQSLLADPRRGAVGPCSNYVSGEQQIATPTLSSMEEINRFANDLAVRRKGVTRVTQRLVGFCLLVRDRVFDEVGMLDEQFGIGNFEDDDYCLRIMKSGYECRIADDCFVFHYGNRTFQSMGIVGDSFHALCDTNGQRFAAKWDEASLHSVSRQLAELALQTYDGGDLAAAMRLMKEAIARGPRIAENYVDLAAILERAGSREKALEYLRRAQSLAPASSPIVEKLATLERDVANGER